MRRLAAVLAAALVGLSACTSGIDPAAFDVGATRFLDRDPVVFRAPGPQVHPVHGVDVAKWQGDIDWRLLRAGGASFAFIKATEGADHLDRRFQENWREAREAGIPRGAYHFFYFCSPAAAQAAWFIRNVPRERGSLPPVLDMEWNAHSPSCGKRVPRERALAEMRTFIGMIERHYGTSPVIYTTVDFHADVMKGEFEGYDLWLRSTKDHVDDVYPSRRGRWTFWQYTATGRAPGVEGDIDLNAFRGGRAAWQRWARRRML